MFEFKGRFRGAVLGMLVIAATTGTAYPRVRVGAMDGPGHSGRVEIAQPAPVMDGIWSDVKAKAKEIGDKIARAACNTSLLNDVCGDSPSPAVNRRR